MCIDKSSLYSLVLVRGGTVLMGNDYAYEKKGVGTVRIKLHDRTIDCLVRYVTDLKKNLIPVEALESKGFKIMIKARVLKITSGALSLWSALDVRIRIFCKEGQ